MVIHNISEEFKPLITDSISYILYDFSGELEYRDKERLIRYLLDNNVPWTSFREDVIVCKYEYEIPKKYQSNKIHTLLRPNNIDRMPQELYEHVRPYIQKVDGTWCEQLKGYLFAFYKEDPKDFLLKLLDNPISESSSLVSRETFQYYPTPTAIARRLVKAANLTNNDSVLEPSAGQGDLLDCMPPTAKKVAIELNNTDIRVLKEKGYKAIQMDFLDYNEQTFSKIVMNPPFGNALDVRHIRHAYSLLEEGGTLVTVLNENTLYYRAGIYKEFRQFLKYTKHDIQLLPIGSFKESGTSINTCILKLYK